MDRMEVVSVAYAGMPCYARRGLRFTLVSLADLGSIFKYCTFTISKC